ncbi:protein zwilch homolog [Diadema setosum]|uniref:protein zwilch homolog n=1 Tax=Diadema setosum TaxID=31175 RepID=UPI003B3B3681
MEAMKQKIEELLEVLQRFKESIDTDVQEFGNYKLTPTCVCDTRIAELLPPAEQMKCIILVQNSERQVGKCDSSYNNGDTSRDSELDIIPEREDISGFDSQLQDTSLLAVEDARDILSMYTLIHSPSMRENNGGAQRTPLLPIWIQCDSRDPERTALLGCEVVQGSSQDEWQLVVTTVTSEGPIQSKSDIPSLQEILLRGHGDASSKNMITQAFAQYEVICPVCADTSLSETHASSFAAVECTWSNVKKTIQSPIDASCKVLIRAVPGDISTTPLAVHQELCMLVMFTRSLTTREVSWPTKERKVSIEDLINDLLADIREGPQYRRKLGDESEDGENKLCWRSAFDRSDLDFTEKIWIILRDNATCYDDIKTAFALVISELNKGLIQPMIHGNNKTSLAEQIRLLYKDPSHVLDLHQFPMVLLVEIGIDKLQRDYTHFFIAQKLTTLHSLEWYITPIGLLTPADLVSRLECLHCVLQLTILASQSLGLPTNNILTLIRSALAHYKGHPPDDQHTFVLPVELTAVQNHYKDKLPSIWRMTAQSGARAERTSSVYQLSHKPLFDIESTSIQDVLVDENADAREVLTYYATHIKRECVHYP